MDMALLKFFSKSSSSLPSAKDTGIGEATIKEANGAVSWVLPVTEKQPQQSSSAPADRQKVKRKYTSFSAEESASIGRYAAEHSNSATVKKFKSDFEQSLGESTVRLFKKRYLEELKKVKETLPVGEAPAVKEIAVKARGRPLLVGEFDADIQSYINALRKAGTPVSVPVVLAAAEGVITARNRSALLKYGGHIELGRPWAVSILRQMGFVQRRGSTQTKEKLSDQQVSQMKHTYLSQVGRTRQLNNKDRLV